MAKDTSIRLTDREKKLSSRGEPYTSVERVLRFPLPKWNNPLCGDLIVARNPYCVCYQYSVDPEGYGPYGFGTQRAREIIRAVFGDLQFWSVNAMDLIRRDLPTESGVYFYDDPPFIEKLRSQLSAYRLGQTKKTILEKRGQTIDSLSSPPALVTLCTEKGLDGLAMSHLLRESSCLFIRHFYSPEAGDTLILFDEGPFNRLKAAAAHLAVEVSEADAIENMKPW